MLKNLHIENIAVIEKTDIDLSSGFNALTGETGAGKSIVIDSINAVLGERTSKELIRSGCERAEVCALFCNLSSKAINVLSDNGFEPDEDGNLLIRRVLSISGNGSVKINGKPATVGILKSIGNVLVNIHGQHDNQGLLNSDTHYIYIDKIAENSDILNEYYTEFKHLNAVRRELETEETNDDEKQRKLDLLKFEIDEIEKADIKIGELKSLKDNLEIAENYQKTVDLLSTAYNGLNGTDDSDGAVSLISNSQKSLSAVNGDNFSSTVQKLYDALSLLEDATCDIRSFLQSAEYSSFDTENLRQRLDLLYKLMLKYGNSEEEVLRYLENARTQLSKIEMSDKRIAELSAQLDKSTERLISLGDKLTQSRKATAEKFAKKVTEVLKQLDMPNVVFSVKIEKTRYTKYGCDNVEFIIRTNLGEEYKPLCKIASGGELSRIMLAIKSVLANKDDVDTLIFDEIDSGISGRAANKVGMELKGVSNSRQVICVTHLAQIAVCADTHLLIEKSVNDGRTYTTVTPLSYEERIKEVARIMSGTDITDNLYNSAKELLDRSKNNGNL